MVEVLEITLRVREAAFVAIYVIIVHRMCMMINILMYSY